MAKSFVLSAVPIPAAVAGVLVLIVGLRWAARSEPKMQTFAGADFATSGDGDGSDIAAHGNVTGAGQLFPELSATERQKFIGRLLYYAGRYTFAEGVAGYPTNPANQLEDLALYIKSEGQALNQQCGWFASMLGQCLSSRVVKVIGGLPEDKMTPKIIASFLTKEAFEEDRHAKVKAEAGILSDSMAARLIYHSAADSLLSMDELTSQKDTAEIAHALGQNMHDFGGMLEQYAQRMQEKMPKVVMDIVDALADNTDEHLWGVEIMKVLLTAMPDDPILAPHPYPAASVATYFLRNPQG